MPSIGDNHLESSKSRSGYNTFNSLRMISVSYLVDSEEMHRLSNVLSLLNGLIAISEQ